MAVRFFALICGMLQARITLNRLKGLSPEDVEFIRGVAISDSREGLKASQEQLVKAVTFSLFG
jgi:hypothetical protein